MKILWLVALGALLAACEPRPRLTPSEADEDSEAPGASDRRVTEFDLSHGAPEAIADGLFQMPATRTYAGLVRALERGLAENTTASVFVRLGDESFGVAQAEEIGSLLERYQKKKIPVVCHANTLTNGSAALVSRGCSRRWLSPAGSMDTVGIAAQLVYLKGLLDRFHVEVDFLAMGRFKSGAEPLTREGPSENATKNLTETLGGVRQGWLASAGALGPELEKGPYSPEEAKSKGLIQAIGYESEALEEAKKLGAVKSSASSFGPRSGGHGGFDISEIVRVIAGGEEGTHQPHIAIVPAEGAIGMEGGGPFENGGITYRALSKVLKKLGQDESVKVVVLRIDSPGGSALASDLLWHEVMELKKKKPVIASVGGMAASGGYYIACAAQSIVAEPTSIVGSIGVFGGKVVLGPALAGFGINSVTFPASPEPGAAARAAYLSPLQPWDDATRERVQAELKGIYDLFVSRVAAGRKLPEDAVRERAEGRIYAASQALENKLIDQLGGLDETLRLARQLGHLGEDAPVTVEGASESLLDMLSLGQDASETEIREAFVDLERRRQFDLKLLPLELRPFAASLAPLLRGERIVAAAPYAFELR